MRIVLSSGYISLGTIDIDPQGEKEQNKSRIRTSDTNSRPSIEWQKSPSRSDALLAFLVQPAFGPELLGVFTVDVFPAVHGVEIPSG